VPITAAVVWYGAASKREWEVNKLQPARLQEITKVRPRWVWALSAGRARRERKNKSKCHRVGDHGVAAGTVVGTSRGLISRIEDFNILLWRGSSATRSKRPSSGPLAPKASASTN
jgi:hypothetical protein